MMARRSAKTGKWKISKHAFYAALHYALQYPEWKDEYEMLSDSTRAIVYDNPCVQVTIDANPTERLAERRAELADKIRIVEEAAKEAEPSLYNWLLMGVTREYATFSFLQGLDIPCGKDMYYDRRRKFYYLLAGKM